MQNIKTFIETITTTLKTSLPFIDETFFAVQRKKEAADGYEIYQVSNTNELTAVSLLDYIGNYFYLRIYEKINVKKGKNINGCSTTYNFQLPVRFVFVVKNTELYLLENVISDELMSFHNVVITSVLLNPFEIILEEVGYKPYFDPKTTTIIAYNATIEGMKTKNPPNCIDKNICITC